MRKLPYVIGLVLTSILITSVYANVILTNPTEVSYTVSNSLAYSEDMGILGSLTLNITTTLHFEAVFNCTTEGDLPPNTTCHVNTSKKTASTNVTYHIDISGSNTDGQYSLPMPEVLGDTPTAQIPLGSTGMSLSVSLHGHLLADANPDRGTATPKRLTWTSWGTQNTAIGSNETTVILTLNTTYSFYFTIAFTYLTFEIFPQNSTAIETVGEPSPEIIISENPSSLILLLCVSVPIILFQATSKNRPWFHGAMVHSTLSKSSSKTAPEPKAR